MTQAPGPKSGWIEQPTTPPAPGPGPETLLGATLPSFRFSLGTVEPKRWGKSWAKEATVREFPPSQAIAGVSMHLEPGAERELHWHANAAEWAYMLGGNARVTVTDPSGWTEIVDFAKGDIWYFPRGHAHSIQGLGPAGCDFILVFDNGYFSEFGTFSISDWVAHTPLEVVAKNFRVPESALAGLPKGEVYIADGPVPPALGPIDDEGRLSHRYPLHQGRLKTFGGGTLRIASVKEFPISTTMTGVHLALKPQGLREMHWHPNANEWQFYISGRARMTVFGSGGRAMTDVFGPGDVGYVPQGYGHYIEAVGDEPVSAILVLDNGTYEEIALDTWMAGNTPQLLSTNFGLSEDLFATIDKADGGT